MHLALGPRAVRQALGPRVVRAPCRAHQLHHPRCISPDAAPPQVQPSTQHAFAEFLRGLGADEQQIAVAVRDQADKLPGWSPYASGQVLAWLKENADLSSPTAVSRVVSCYPGLLTRTVDELEEVVQQLRDTELFAEEASLQRLLNTCPSILLQEIVEDTMPVLKLIQRSRINKYVNSGSYHI